MPHAAVSGLYGVRYQVRDVARAIDFYTQKLGFKLERKHLPAFAQVSVGDFKLTLSGPGASGSRPGWSTRACARSIACGAGCAW